MADRVYEVKELLLDDGSTVTCKPAVIKVQRKAIELIGNLGLTDEETEAENAEEIATRKILDIVYLLTKRQRPDFETEETTTVDGKKVKKTVPNYDLMEELFDYDTMFEVIHRFTGVKLNDPKLVEAMTAAALAAEQVGTQSPSQS